MRDRVKTVLSFAAVFAAMSVLVWLVYQRYLREEMLSSGQILCNQIMNANLTYYSEHGIYLTNDKVSFNKDFPLDARTNPYFSVFSTYPLENNKQGITVFGSDKMQNYEIRLEYDEEVSKSKSIKDLKMKVVKK